MPTPTWTILSQVRAGLVAVLSGLTTPDGSKFDAVFPVRPELDARTETIISWLEFTGYDGGQRIADGLTEHKWPVVIVCAFFSNRVGEAEPPYAALATIEDQFVPTVVSALATYPTANVIPGGIATPSGTVQRTELDRSVFEWFETQGHSLWRIDSFWLTVVNLEMASYTIPS